MSGTIPSFEMVSRCSHGYVVVWLNGAWRHDDTTGAVCPPIDQSDVLAAPQPETGEDLRPRERCVRCNRENVIGFAVSNELWANVVPKMYHNSVLCPWCFDGFAERLGVSWAREASLYVVDGTGDGMAWEIAAPDLRRRAIDAIGEYGEAMEEVGVGRKDNHRRIKAYHALRVVVEEALRSRPQVSAPALSERVEQALWSWAMEKHGEPETWHLMLRDYLADDDIEHLARHIASELGK